MFYDAIKAKYPKMNVIASTVNITNRPGDSSGDYHQYTRPDMFVSQYDYFDNFSTVHKTLLGEYACVQPNNATDKEVDWTQGLAGLLPWPEWIGTVSEAVYLIGAERNADKIIGASYAPLLQNLNRFQWSVSHLPLHYFIIDRIEILTQKARPHLLHCQPKPNRPIDELPPDQALL
jgi:alpha-N-arabinofuranosidase